MNEPGTSSEMAADNQKALEEIAWAIEMSQGQFALLLAQCNFARLQTQMTEQLQRFALFPFEL
jgi:hypothetical protein